MIIGTILGFFIGMNLTPVEAEYDLQVLTTLRNIDSTLRNIDNTLGSIDMDSIGRKIGSIDDKMEMPNPLSIFYEIKKAVEDVERAVKRNKTDGGRTMTDKERQDAIARLKAYRKSRTRDQEATSAENSRAAEVEPSEPGDTTVGAFRAAEVEPGQ